MGQLDALRAFAVGAVMPHHFFGGNILSQNLPVGGVGLFLSFVLSGFLIPGILLRGDGTARFVGQFYPRTLALSPVTVVLASLSWFFYERPINRLRDRFLSAGSLSGALREGGIRETSEAPPATIAPASGLRS